MVMQRLNPFRPQTPPVQSYLNPYFLGIEPPARFFEEFGIGGSTRVISRNGDYSIAELGPDIAVATREYGFVQPIGILRSEVGEKSEKTAKGICVPTDFFGKASPMNRTVIGRANTIHAPIHRDKSKRPKIVRFPLREHRPIFDMFSTGAQRLFTPVFETRTTLHTRGLYIRCPGLEDLANNCVAH